MSYEAPNRPDSSPPRLVLASTSRYRKALLERLGLAFETGNPQVEESSRPGELPEETAARLALAKARSLAAPDAVVIGSDQVAALEGQRLGKPGGREQALEQLAACQGKTVLFHTAVTVLDGRKDAAHSHVDRTEVHFARRSTAELERYVDIEQPYDCAGSFKAEGLGVALFESIESRDPTALIGLPLIWLVHALNAAGLDPLGAAPRHSRAR